jgi:hypothetical protein
MCTSGNESWRDRGETPAYLRASVSSRSVTAGRPTE